MRVLYEIGKGAIRVLRIALLLVGVFYIITSYFLTVGTVDGSSMEPTLENGDAIVVDILSPRISGYKRFDVVAFRYRHAYDQTYIKRVVGLPGETVEIRNGMLHVDGMPLTEDTCGAGADMGPLALEEGEYFVLGDNREHSRDSRTAEVGAVRQEEMIGTAWFVCYPLRAIQVLTPGHLPLCLVFLAALLLFFLWMALKLALRKTEGTAVGQTIAPPPVVQVPRAPQPAMQQPVAQQPTMQQPVAQPPMTARPAMQYPVAKPAVTPQPTVQQSVAQQPIMQMPGMYVPGAWKTRSAPLSEQTAGRGRKPGAKTADLRAYAEMAEAEGRYTVAVVLYQHCLDQLEGEERAKTARKLSRCLRRQAGTALE